MSKESSPHGLAADTKRQATDTIRGFVFQLWHSVYAWIELRDDEQLFLEGAEDFDILHEGEAVVTQLKATQSGMSLGTREAQKAIDNFWGVQKANPEISVRYRLVTTSAIVEERGQPFNNRNGLDLWNNCVATDTATVEAIRRFLLAQNKGLSVELKAFVQTAKPEDFFEKLISRMSWDAAQAPSPGVQLAIAGKLVSHGDRFGVLPSQSEKVASRLLEEVASVASSKQPRVLKREDFLRIFEEETHVSIPAKTARHELAALFGQFASVGTGDAVVALGAAATVQTAAPPLPPIARRPALVQEIRRRLNNLPVLAIHGSSGGGKTMLAAASIEGEANVAWLNLRGFEGTQVRRALEYLSSYAERSGRIDIAVLDDLPLTGGDYDRYEHALAALVYALRSQRSRLLITAQRQLPTLLLQRLELTPDNELAAPSFAQNDIIELAVRLGCSSDLAKTYATLIEVQTRGHPQLVHARVLALGRANWPAVSGADLISTPAEISQVRSEARQLVKDLSAGELELLYRLSVIGGMFRRDQAVAIGSLKPEIAAPGDCFDRLLGPWVETVSPAYYRISPLLENCGAAVWTAEAVKGLQEVIGGTLIACGNLTPHEVNRMLMLGLQSRSAGLIITAGSMVLRQDAKTQKELARHLSWLEFLGTGKPIFPDSGMANVIVRMLQLLVASQTQTSLDTKFVDCLEAEFTKKRVGEGYRVPRFSALSKVLAITRIAIRPSRLVGIIQEIATLENELQHEVNKEHLIFKAFGRSLSLATYSYALVAFRCDDINFLDELIASLRSGFEEARAHFRLFFRELPFLARHLVDRAWLGEEDKKKDWEFATATLQRAIAFADDFGVPELKDFALRALVVVLDEYVGDKERAATELKRHWPASPSLLLQDEHATLLLHDKRYDEALSIWERILPSWRDVEELRSTTVAYAWRKAAIAAADGGKWPRSAELFHAGGASATAAKDVVLATGLTSDSAFALWRSGETEAAIRRFTAALTDLEALPHTKEELRAFKLAKTLGQTLIYIYNEYEGVKNQAAPYAPPPGFCSDPFIHDKIRELPDANLETLWVFLLLIEIHARSRPFVYMRVRARLHESLVPPVRLFFAEAQLARAVLNCRFGDVLMHSLEFARIFRICKSHVTTAGSAIANIEAASFVAGSSSDDFSLSVNGLYAALVVQLCHGSLNESALSEWRESSASIAIATELESWLETAQLCFRMSTNELHRLVLDANAPFWTRGLAALRLSSEEAASAEQLFCAHLTVIWTLGDNPIQRIIGVELGDLYGEQWLKRIEFTAALKTPRLTVPAIRAACVESRPGLQKPARILLAVAPAVSVRIPASSHAQLAKLADVQSA